MDYAEYGGAPLIGLDGLCVIGHGRSSAKAVRSAVMMTAKLVNERLLDRLTQEVAAVGSEPRTPKLEPTPNPEPKRTDPNPETRARMIAFVFPGQGAQKVGMGKALAEAFPICRQTFEEADDALGESLSRLCFDGPESQLLLTEYTQPAILAVSVAACRAVTPRGVAASYAAGHSLGEYSAHVAAGTLSFADALRTVRRRGQFMQEAVPVGEGAMSAILGADADTVARACAEARANLRARSFRRPT